MKVSPSISPSPEVPSAVPSAVGLPAQTGGGLFRPKRVTDLVGRTFGRLKVVSFAGVSAKKDRTSYWKTKCSCGNDVIVNRKNLLSGNTTSCGCYQREIAGKYKQVSLIGRTFGRLTVISKAPNKNNNWSTYWNCRCSCGKTSVVHGHKLSSGHTKSCGCLASEKLKARIGAKNPAWDQTLTAEDRGRARLGTAEHARMYNIARQIRARDRMICLICGTYPGTHVHHIEPWAINRALRYAPANLVTLCKTCHCDFHSLHGRDGGFDEFMDFMKGINDGD